MCPGSGARAGAEDAPRVPWRGGRIRAGESDLCQAIFPACCYLSSIPGLLPAGLRGWPGRACSAAHPHSPPGNLPGPLPSQAAGRGRGRAPSAPAALGWGARGVLHPRGDRGWVGSKAGLPNQALPLCILSSAAHLQEPLLSADTPSLQVPPSLITPNPLPAPDPKGNHGTERFAWSREQPLAH